MIVISRNGETIVLTGWREWGVRAIVFLAAVLLMAVLVFLFFGLAVTLGAILLVVVPALILVGFLGSMFAARP